MSGRHGGDGKTVGWLRGRLADMTRRLAEAEEDRARLRAELAEAEQHIKAQSEVDRILSMGFGQAANGDTGPIARPQGHRAPAHRTPPDQRWLKAVPGFVPLAAFTRQGWEWAASHTAVAVTGATAATVVVAGAGIVTLSGPPATAHPPGHATSLPATGLWDAAPMSPPAAKPKAAAARSRPLVTLTPVPEPAATVTASPSSPPAPPPPPPAAAGVLDVTQASVTLRPGNILGELTGTLTLTAVGGEVDWSASAPGLSLDSAGGVIPSGQTVTVVVSVPLGQAGGSGTVTLWPGGVTVQVLWLAGLPGALPSSLGL